MVITGRDSLVLSSKLSHAAPLQVYSVVGLCSAALCQAPLFLSLYPSLLGEALSEQEVKHTLECRHRPGQQAAKLKCSIS